MKSAFVKRTEGSFSSTPEDDASHKHPHNLDIDKGVDSASQKRETRHEKWRDRRANLPLFVDDNALPRRLEAQANLAASEKGTARDAISELRQKNGKKGGDSQDVGRVER
ncbi:uncharacterized protein SPSK_05709 [Sporothrix schenckii 1099-18]|uniref:Uncharacterized protein n=1 Tax=Sporothrix schenckii 1099-18 TaxID=1397361 RepID=A0A0F2LTJ7_SPOSC|nr:uncharacterized protein SPSK_05709 [Sporothrix schenckii 1099-18]KJR80179.1 hypothetical protein SPSK_05709 [Sporothrix schenckii 1099-18]